MSSNLPSNQALAWLLRLNIPDPVEASKVFQEVIESERKGKDMTIVKKGLEEKYGVTENIWREYENFS